MSVPSRPERIAFMFAGQGSQYFFMGRELYEQHRLFRDWFEYCSRLLQPHLGRPLAGLLYSSGNERFAPFDKTRQTHPAIFALNFCMAQTLLAEGVRPSAFLGYSLGEMVAWTLAGVVRVEEALPAVCEMAARIEEKTAPGGMLAILASPDFMRSAPELFQGLSTACLNFPEHFVVSGPRERIAVLAEILKKRHVASLVLPISHAFHSNLLDPVEPDIKNIFTALPLRQPEKPVISSCLARAAAVEDLNPQHGWEVLRKPVRFQETVLFMEKEGPWTYIDAGPSGTLASFIRNIAEPAGSSSRAFPILTPFGKDLRGLEKLKQALGL